MDKIELLAPAGNIESFKAACSACANAIYMGLPKFNARVMATNLDMIEYIECIKYAHIRGIKVYLTLNTLMLDNEIKEAIELTLELYSHGLDAVIVQDLGLASLIHNILPKLDLHASTQMSVYSLEQVNYLKTLGFKRVVLARELSISEIEYICKNTDVEIEVFVHGALCVSVSGQCLFSSVIGDRSANNGSCAQPCRLKYSLYNENNKLIVKDRYLLSKKDIFGLNHIKRLYEAGVSSLKIEGRNKTKEYVAGVVKAYREHIDKLLTSNDDSISKDTEAELLQLFSRSGKSSGYLDGVGHKESITELSPKNTGLMLGKVIDTKSSYIKVKLQKDINMHDGIEILSDEGYVFSNIVTCIRNDKFEIINKEAKEGDIVWLGDFKKAKAQDLIYKTTSTKLIEKYENYSSNYFTRRSIRISVTIKENEKINVSIPEFNLNFRVDYIPQTAINKCISKEDVLACFSKTLDTNFLFDIELNISDNLFVPTSQLNSLRRLVVENLEEFFEINIDISKSSKELDSYLNICNNESLCKEAKKSCNSLYIYRLDSEKDYENIYYSRYLKRLERVYINIYDYLNNSKYILENFKCDIYLHIPNVVLNNMNTYINNNLESFLKQGIKGFLLGSLVYFSRILELKDIYNFNIIADYTLNITNSYTANFLISLGFNEITISPEIDSSVISLRGIKYEQIADYITVMTSRYCIVGSFLNEGSKCSKPCIRDKYHLVDYKGKRYDTIFDNQSCIMRLVTSFKTLKETDNTRHVFIS